MIVKNRMLELAFHSPTSLNVDFESSTQWFDAHDVEPQEAGDVQTSLSPEGAIELLGLKFRIAALEEEVAELRSAALSPNATKTCHSPGSDPCLADVFLVTQEMFGSPEVTLDVDPEEPDQRYIVFTVCASGGIDYLVEKRIEWHDRVSCIPPGSSGSFRLSIIPQE